MAAFEISIWSLPHTKHPQNPQKPPKPNHRKVIIKRKEKDNGLRSFKGMELSRGGMLEKEMKQTKHQKTNTKQNTDTNPTRKKDPQTQTPKTTKKKQKKKKKKNPISVCGVGGGGGGGGGVVGITTLAAGSKRGGDYDVSGTFTISFEVDGWEFQAAIRRGFLDEV